MYEIAPDVAVVPMAIVNAYLVGTRDSWVVVDTGMPGNSGTLARAARKRFGPDSRPGAIVLTHGHFDHAGSASRLADLWSVPVCAHRLEWPYLTGKSAYPPPDPTAPGFFAGLSRLFPSRTVNLGDRLTDLNMRTPFRGLDGWESYHTPGHTPGHVAFFRRSDRVLLAGDAFTTMDLDSAVGTLLKQPKICRPPVPATTDWNEARISVEMLASLKPKTIGAGHGHPMSGAADQLQYLADHFTPPAHGRYVAEPAQADENGIIYLPPKPVDRVPAVAAAVLTGVVAAIASQIRRRHDEP